MKRTGFFLVTILGLASLTLGGTPLLAAGQRWTLATDDTILTLGMDDQGRPAIFELKNPARQLNWTERPSPIPLLNRVASGGKISTATEEPRIYRGSTAREITEKLDRTVRTHRASSMAGLPPP